MPPPIHTHTASHPPELLVLLREAAEAGPPHRPSCLWCCVCVYRKCGLMWSKALSCLGLITMVALLPRVRRLRPERRKCLPALPRSPEGAEPNGSQPLPPGRSLAFSTETWDTRAAWSLGYRKGSLGPQPGRLGLAGPGQQSKRQVANPSIPEANPAARESTC